MSSIQEVDNSKMREKSGLYSVPMQVAEPLLLRGDCVELLEKIPSDSIDAIITDPPYLYLNSKEKNSAFDKPFDERKVFLEYKRILKPTGFLLFFGRGQAFYRWNTMIAEMGFIFKEEIVWNKTQVSSPFLALARKHETIAVYGKSKKACVRVNYFPYKEHLNNMSVEEAIADIYKNLKLLKRAVKRENVFQEIIDYLDTGVIKHNQLRKQNNNVTIHNKTRYSYGREVGLLKAIEEGRKEGDVINIIPDIIEMASNSVPYHPTQKPARLMERLIAIVSDEGDVVLDSFMGSGTTGVACLNTGRRFIGMELAEEYFEVAKERVEKAVVDAKNKQAEERYE
mgnify:CR=1 FL=1